jgi:hypothetical protein
MGKLFTLLIVFTAGFVCALYYVASGNENYQANDKAVRITNTINGYLSSTYGKINNKLSNLENKQTGSSREPMFSDNSQDNYQSVDVTLRTIHIKE